MENEIMEILRDIRPEFEFSDSENYIDDGYLDSFDLVTLVSEIEAKYGVLIDGLDVIPENFMSVDAICNLINNSKKKE